MASRCNTGNCTHCTDLMEKRNEKGRKKRKRMDMYSRRIRNKTKVLLITKDLPQWSQTQTDQEGTACLHGASQRSFPFRKTCSKPS